MPPTTAPPRRISWISAPPEICTLCKEPLGVPEETSAWDGRPAHPQESSGFLSRSTSSSNPKLPSGATVS
ncbi:MAG: hypothetical protein L3J81_03515, partial [Thermoplasmata archaeon]|nr:hypothetical protein [Thermoplasmata archaeon]